MVTGSNEAFRELCLNIGNKVSTIDQNVKGPICFSFEIRYAPPLLVITKVYKYLSKRNVLRKYIDI